MINIEVIYATGNDVEIVPISIHTGATVLAAIKQSGMINRHP
ncbi:MAG: RnfH family protein, partial [Gammaproteobacteria bacterium]|nr:RnfH family protein [Gammaproteobacteria bacterium]